MHMNVYYLSIYMKFVYLEIFKRNHVKREILKIGLEYDKRTSHNKLYRIYLDLNISIKSIKFQNL